MARTYIYKLTVDRGAAPCISNGVLSLAICKPVIRSTAQCGSTILGFAANSLYQDNCLVYIATVTKPPVDGMEYFSQPEYAGRPDCIYHWDETFRRFRWKETAKFHSQEDLVHDLGEFPDYRRAKVLLSEGGENFRYFGERCPIAYKKRYPLLGRLVEHLGQGHRVNLEAELLSEVREFKDSLWPLASTFENTPVPNLPCRDTCTHADDDFETIDC